MDYYRQPYDHELVGGDPCKECGGVTSAGHDYCDICVNEAREAEIEMLIDMTMEARCVYS